MQTYIATKNELVTVVNDAVRELLEEAIPTLIRKAKRKDWLTTEDLMELTGWSRRTLQYLRDKRRIPFSQEGRRILYKTEDIEAYLKSNKIEAKGCTNG
jgi:excisionase family DNA binding protein